jgi:xanthine dehydrogenase/oxidase
MQYENFDWPSIHVTGTCCRTNQNSHTAFRGAGVPQGMVVCETVLEHLADSCKLPSHLLRSLNMYKEGDSTHFGTVLDSWNVTDAWNEMIVIAKFEERQKSIELFNKQNKWKKRGLSMLPTKYGMSFTVKSMNQAAALVHCYLDGSVLVSHGGIEMGQGLHTKVIQITARALGIPHQFVRIVETNTACVANAMPSAGSMSTDLYGMAVLNACEIIKNRLKIYFERANPSTSWREILGMAYTDRVNLSAQGFYIVPEATCSGFDFELDTDKNEERGTPFNYFTQGVACTEVELDCLSGGILIYYILIRR